MPVIDRLFRIVRRLGGGGAPRAAVEIAFNSRRIFLDPANGSDLVASQFAAGCYEPPLPAMLTAALRRAPGLFLDVGANSGVYSIIAATADRRVTVRAYEPYPPVLEVLRRNIAMNGLGSRVAVEPIALGAEAATMTLHIPSDAHGLLETSCSLDADFQPTVGAVEVSVRPLDAVIGSAIPTVIKADIEGHEAKFMEGARRTVERCRPTIFYEMLGRSGREAAVTAFKDSVGYIDYRLRPDAAILDDAVLFDGLAWNHALVPRERQAQFVELAIGCGLRVEAGSGSAA